VKLAQYERDGVHDYQRDLEESYVGVSVEMSQWVGTRRTAELCFPIPPVGTVHAAFTAHGPRLVGLFSSLTSDMVPCVESINYPGYPRSPEV
jgi:hypothetical protein